MEVFHKDKNVDHRDHTQPDTSRHYGRTLVPTYSVEPGGYFGTMKQLSK